MSQPTEAGATRARARILDAALTEFAARGFQRTSLRRVAAAAGASLGRVQHYFPTKEALEHAVFEDALERLVQAQVGAFRAADDDIESFVREGFRGYFAFVAANPRVARLGAWLALEGRGDPWPGEGALEARLVERLSLAAPSLVAHDPRTILAVIGAIFDAWAILHPLYLPRLGHLGEAAGSQLADAAADIVLRGVLRRGEAAPSAR